MLRGIANTAIGLKSLGDYAWASLPSAASYSGYLARVTDVGVPCLWVVSDGTRWGPAGVQLLSESAVAVAGAADTNENTLTTISIPANLLGIARQIRFRALVNFTNNANNKTFRVRYSAIGGTAVYSSVLTTQQFQPLEVVIAAQNSAAAQLAVGYSGATLNSYNTLIVDTTAATTLLLTGQKATGSDTVQVLHWTAEIL